MSPDDFRSACQILWGNAGGRWGSVEAAAHLKVNLRNVYYWAAGRKVIPPGVEAELLAEIDRRILDPGDTTPGLWAFRQRALGQGTQAA